MPVPYANSAAILLAAVAAPASAAPGGPRFERAFATDAAPRWSEATIAYRGADGPHRLLLVRDGERRVRRDTDGRLTSIVTHGRDAADYRLDLYDRGRRIHTVVDRDGLYRQGRFTDWLDLAHGLRHPTGAYAIRVSNAPHAAPQPVAPCRWFTLEQTGGRTTICWSAAEALPLVVLDARDRPVWRIEKLSHDQRPDAFRIDGAGYVLNDARVDMSAD